METLHYHLSIHLLLIEDSYLHRNGVFSVLDGSYKISILRSTNYRNGNNVQIIQKNNLFPILYVRLQWNQKSYRNFCFVISYPSCFSIEHWSVRPTRLWIILFFCLIEPRYKRTVYRHGTHTSCHWSFFQDVNLSTVLLILTLWTGLREEHGKI